MVHFTVQPSHKVECGIVNKGELQESGKLFTQLSLGIHLANKSNADVKFSQPV